MHIYSHASLSKHPSFNNPHQITYFLCLKCISNFLLWYKCVISKFMYCKLTTKMMIWRDDSTEGWLEWERYILVSVICGLIKEFGENLVCPTVQWVIQCVRNQLTSGTKHAGTLTLDFPALRKVSNADSCKHVWRLMRAAWADMSHHIQSKAQHFA